MSIDTIGDFLTVIRNGIMVNRRSVTVPHSIMKENVAKVLKDEGYIQSFEVVAKGSKKALKIVLKYNRQGKNVINALKRISTPGRHQYAGHQKLPKIQGGFGTAVISTSQGVMTDSSARQKKIGGEILCYIW